MNGFDSKLVQLDRSKKWFILFILVISIFVGYIARMSISVALPFISQEFAWSIEDQGLLGGLLLGIFLLGYGLSNVIFSKYIDIYGSKVVLTFSILLWSFSLLLGAVIPQYYVILGSRFLLGISQGVLFPVASKITSNWFSPDERARANSIFVSGGPWAVMFAPVLLTPVILAFDWQFSFLVVFVLGLLLVIPVLLFITSSPTGSEDSTVQKKELNYSSILKNRNFQILLIGYTLMSSVWWGLSLWLPTYLVKAKGLELAQISYGASLPYIGAIIGMYTGSYISDKLGRRRDLIMVSLSTGGVFILLLTLLGLTDIYVVLFLLIMVFFTGQMGPPIYFTILQSRIKPEKMGSATGLMNGIGNGFGILGPLSVGAVLLTIGSYELAFAILGLMLLAGGGSLLLYEDDR